MRLRSGSPWDTEMARVVGDLAGLEHGKLARHAPAIGRHLCRNHRHNRVTDLDLVAFLHQLGQMDAAPVEVGSVRRTEVFDVPQATNSLKTSMMTGGKVVVDSEVAITAGGEVGTEGMALVSYLDDQRPAARRLGEGVAALPGDGGHGGLPGLLLLLGDVFP